ncbi:MAG: hypothetical protein J6W19_11070 [Prevotella sp.]|nr:hypothetical protein [Prevotella sp.]
MKYFLTILTTCLLLGCSSSDSHDKQYLLQGAWILRQVVYPYGHTDTFSEQEGAPLRLYDGDSVIYTCLVAKTETGLIVRHSMKNRVTLIEKGNGEYVYLEDDDPRPLTVANDTTIVIQRNGSLSTWHRADDIAKEWGEEIRDIVTADLQRPDADDTQNYMLSAKERSQANVIHWLFLSTVGGIILLLLIARIAVQNRKAKRRLQLQLKQIQEIQEERPQSVRQAIESVESSFYASDDYQMLQRRIATGQLLKDDDWHDIEAQLRKVYPGFGSQLRGLYTMSELEYQVCLLIKLRIAPKDIATILARDMSTISTVRSRLYKKVFGRKGGARDWDEFILSM